MWTDSYNKLEQNTFGSGKSINHHMTVKKDSNKQGKIEDTDLFHNLKY